MTDVNQELSKLRSQGYRINIKHERLASNVSDIETEDYLNKAHQSHHGLFKNVYDLNQVSNFGGRCFVEIEKDGRVIASGLSICSLKDNYDKRVARIKAGGRALSAFYKNEGR